MIPMVHRVEFTRVFSAAHRVWNDDGKCANIHGHNYTARVGIVLDGRLTQQGFVTPFEVVKGVIDFYDHTLILDTNDPLLARPQVTLFHELEVRHVPGVPSTEFMAQLFADAIGEKVYKTGRAVRLTVMVALRETAGIEATAESEWPR